ncbi:MAG: hypothetical protein ACKVOK_03940 [Flavobacteriales bacterium]
MISCKKGKDTWPEEFPVVKITSASYNAENASVTITAEIVSSGRSTIEGAGFRLSDRSDFLQDNNEVLTEVVDNKFTYTYYHFFSSQYELDLFNGNKTIYFFAFAVSENGFGVSELQQIGPFEVAQLEVPCELVVDVANVGAFEYNVLSAFQSQEYNEDGDLTSVIYLDLGSTDFAFIFNKIAAPGTYTTTLNIGTAGLFDVSIRDDDYNTIIAGQTVYIEPYDEEHMLVTLCESPFESGTSNTFSTSFLVVIDD